MKKLVELEHHHMMHTQGLLLDSAKSVPNTSEERKKENIKIANELADKFKKFFNIERNKVVLESEDDESPTAPRTTQ